MSENLIRLANGPHLNRRFQILWYGGELSFGAVEGEQFVHAIELTFW